MTGAHQQPGTIQIDRDLCARLEYAESQGTRRGINAWIESHPDCGMATLDLTPGLAICASESSPGFMRRVMGMGFDEPEHLQRQLDDAEAFFGARGQVCALDIAPHVRREMLTLLGDRGYRVTGHVSVMVARSSDIADLPEIPGVLVRGFDATERELYAELAHAGFGADRDDSPAPDVYRLMFEQPGATGFLAEVDGRPAGVGMLATHTHDSGDRERVGSMYGACTLKPLRRRGVHAAVVRARARFAFDQGRALVVVVGSAGRGTERTARRLGFSLAYTKARFEKP